MSKETLALVVLVYWVLMAGIIVALVLNHFLGSGI